MPAYRSSAEADVREAAVARLRVLRPGARIIHEISNGWSNRIDVLAVSPEEIVAVEVKSEKDTLDLLPGQLGGMVRVAHVSIAAVHEALAVKRETNPHYYAVEQDGKFYSFDVPAVKRPAECWIFPERSGSGRWSNPMFQGGKVLPPTALDMIWKYELLDICGQHRISATSRTTCDVMRRDILWHLSGAEWTKAVCRVLRKRVCVEADPPIDPPEAFPAAPSLGCEP